MNKESCPVCKGKTNWMDYPISTLCEQHRKRLQNILCGITDKKMFDPIGASMRKEIKEFAEAMEKEMQRHDPGKGDSWKEMPLHTLEHLLLSEVREWNANRLGHIDGKNHPKEKEVIDIANIAMMLWHRYRKEVQ